MNKTKTQNIGKCQRCGDLTLDGICTWCGWVRVCSYCKKVIQYDSSPKKVKYKKIKCPETGMAKNVTHGMCKPCFDKTIKQLKAEIDSGKRVARMLS